MQDFRCRSDGIAGIDELLVGLGRRRNESEGRRLVAADLPILAGVEPGPRDLITDRKKLRRLPEEEPGLERLDVRGGDLGLVLLLAEEVVQEPDRRVERAIIEPAHDAQRIHIPAAVDVLGAHARVSQRFARQPGHRHPNDLIPAVQLIVVKGVVACFVPALLEVGLVELVLVDNDDPARLHVHDVGLEAGRVHRHQGVHRVPRCEDVGAGELYLEAGDAERGSARGANLSGEVRVGCDIVAEQGSGVGEQPAGELHTVAGVAAKPNGHGVNGFGVNVTMGGVGVRAHESDFRLCGQAFPIPPESSVVL